MATEALDGPAVSIDRFLRLHPELRPLVDRNVIVRSHLMHYVHGGYSTLDHAMVGIVCDLAGRDDQRTAAELRRLQEADAKVITIRVPMPTPFGMLDPTPDADAPAVVGPG